MHWGELKLSHHATETTSCVLSLCSTEYESNHFLAVGKDIGEIDLVNLESREIIAGYNDVHTDKVLGIDFLSPYEIFSYDKRKLVVTDMLTSNNRTIFNNGSQLFKMTHPFQSAPTILSTNDGVYFVNVNNNNDSVKLSNSDNVEELCLLHDTHTLLIVRGSELSVMDIRRPEHICSLGLSFGVVSLACNETHVALVSNSDMLCTLDLPLMRDSFKEHIPIFNAFPARPCFCDSFVCCADGEGSVFIVDPRNPNPDEYESLPVPLKTPCFSITANDSEIAVSLEDDIYVYSLFDFEDNLVKTPYYDDLLAEEEEPEKDDWLYQSTEIVTEDGECTYEKYGYCDQQIYVCRDCITEDEPFGICEQCAKCCHQGHDVRAIGIRHRFRCDCGNNRAKRPCSCMLRAKTVTNPHNTYGHNFFDHWCTCNGEDKGAMVQCICCSDWFHTDTCIGMFPKGQSIPLEEIPDFNGWSFICTKCVNEKLTFLKRIPDKAPIDFLDELVAEASAEVNFTRPIRDSEKGIGFTIKGGRWVPPEALQLFRKEPEYINEFSKLDTTEEDKTLRKASGQDKYANVMRAMYKGLFEHANSQGRTVAQASDVHEVMTRTLSEMNFRRKDDDN